MVAIGLVVSLLARHEDVTEVGRGISDCFFRHQYVAQPELHGRDYAGNSGQRYLAFESRLRP